jgi:hypothetical protein
LALASVLRAAPLAFPTVCFALAVTLPMGILSS